MISLAHVIKRPNGEICPGTSGSSAAGQTQSTLKDKALATCLASHVGAYESGTLGVAIWIIRLFVENPPGSVDVHERPR